MLGFMSESSDMQAQKIELTLEEWGVVIAALEEFGHDLSADQTVLAEQVQGIISKIDQA